jgi:hypothetical protein
MKVLIDKEEIDEVVPPIIRRRVNGSNRLKIELVDTLNLYPMLAR